MQKVMGPHLAAMRSDLEANWPQMEPEIMLLHWLCQRHQLEPPKAPLRKPQSARTAPPDPDGQVVALPAVTRSAPSKARAEESSGTTPRKAPAEAGQVGQLESSPGKWGKLENSPYSTQVSTFAPTEMMNTMASEVSWGYDDMPPGLRVAPCLEARLQARRNDTGPRLRSLGRITSQVREDAMSLSSRTGRFRNKIDDINTHVATLRQQLRGKFLSHVPLLSLNVLTEQEQFWLVGKLRPHTFEANEAIFEEGEIGDQLFIIERGTCQVWKYIDGVKTRICNIDKGDFFGELAVMYDMPRSASVVSVTGVTLLSLSRQDIFSTLSPEKIDKMKVLARTQVFSSVPLLSKLDTKTKVLLAGSLVQESWEQGEIILRENQRVDGDSRRLYILEKGQCMLSQMEEHRSDDAWGHGSKKPKLTRKRSVFMSNDKTCQPGAYFGMLEFLYGCPQMHTLTAQTQATTLSCSYNELQDLLLNRTDIPKEERESACNEVFEHMTRAVRISLIRQVHNLLRACSEQEMMTVLMAAKCRRYAQWETIFCKGQSLEHVSMLEAGSCIEYNGHADTLVENTFAKADCVEYSRPGETFGTRSIIGRKNTDAPFTLVAISECLLLHIPKASIEGLPRMRGLSTSGPSEGHSSGHKNSIQMAE